MQKQELRIEKNNFRKNLSFEEILEKSMKVHENLRSIFEYKNSYVMMYYVSMDYEVDTLILIQEDMKSKKILVPYVEDNNMKASIILSMDDLEKTRLGFLEPKIKLESKNIDVIIVPGTAFDKTGARLGFGKGYYDKFLARYPNTLKLGIAFDEQIVDVVPTEAHDQKVDIIITDKQIIRCK